MERKIVLVEPEIPENTGFIARLSANFGYELRLVNPGFNISEARKTASNAQDKLRDARIFDSVEKAVEDLNYVVGTKPGKGVSAREFSPSGETSIMIGRESSGLTEEELGLCDAVVHIFTEEYSSINQSHAAAILMHSFSSFEQEKSVENGQKKVLKQELPEKTVEAVLESNPSPEELNAMIGELKEK
ncbi:MAG: TrmH family RNA methyltransferase [Candidatus Nanohaloarchaea archaeon]|jgi:TrmH family RNA methyltransferase